MAAANDAGLYVLDFRPVSAPSFPVGLYFFFTASVSHDYDRRRNNHGASKSLRSAHRLAVDYYTHDRSHNGLQSVEHRGVSGTKNSYTIEQQPKSYKIAQNSVERQHQPQKPCGRRRKPSCGERGQKPISDAAPVM